MKKLSFLFFALLFGKMLVGQDLIYKPKNPAFGGDTFNYQWLLSGAQAQDTYKDPNSTLSSFGTTSTSTLDDFTKSLNRLLLSQISQELISSQFGEDGLQPGSYTIGNFNINVGSASDGILIDIADLTTGQTTQVVIPFF